MVSTACNIDYVVNYNNDAVIDCDSFDDIFVVGGLYGNIEAAKKLDQIRKKYPKALFIFNGDIHWFDRKFEDFMLVEEMTHYGVKLLGNVEVELIRNDENYKGCGCSYPEYVDSDVIERSDRIHSEMRKNLEGKYILDEISKRGKFMALCFGGRKIFVTHGDEKNLAGWGLSIVSLKDVKRVEEVSNWMDEKGVDIMAVTHTCDPALLNNDGKVIINNGAAGMPNIKGEKYGIITKISKKHDEESVYGTCVGDVYVEAYPLCYDSEKFERWFESEWPEGSDANLSYMERIKGNLGNNIEEIFTETALNK